MATTDLSLRTVSRNKTNILDLPTDILKNVFDYFQDICIKPDGTVEWSYIDCIADAEENTRRKTLCNSRLVCGLFHDLATPLLCPVFRVELDEASLERMNKISHSPRLAPCVHGIQIVLHYRPKEIATDLSRYKECRRKELEKMDSNCDYCAETWYLGGYDEDDETVCELPYRQYQKGMRSYRKICSAWSEATDPTLEDSESQKEGKDQEFLEYQRILLQGHEAYQKKHEEQSRLIADGSFANVLAASISRMVNANSIGFIDKIDQIPDPYFKDPTLVLTSMEELRKIMTKPHDWRTIEELEGEAELPAPKLLSEVPIAIHKAGVKLRDLYIGCFPVSKNFSMVIPDRQDPSNPAWSELRDACQSLSTFNFGSGSLNYLPIRYDYLPADDQSAMDCFLGAMLGGRSLEMLRLNFYSFGINNGRGRESRHRIGKLLETLVLPCISKLSIGGGAINQNELEQFCTGLGYCLAHLYLYSMDLSSGIWADALDILRDRVGTRGLEGRCEVSAAGLTGGEFGHPEKKKLSVWNLEDWEEALKPEPSIILNSLDYVSGVKIENPLRKNRSDEE